MGYSFLSVNTMENFKTLASKHHQSRIPADFGSISQMPCGWGFCGCNAHDLGEAFFVRWWRQQDEKTMNLVKELVKAGRCQCQNHSHH